MILTTKEEFRARQVDPAVARKIALDKRKRQIATAQANARRFASASILGRIGNRRAWDWVVSKQKRTHKRVCFVVHVYYSNLHLRGYSESETNIPHKAPLRYRLNVFPKRGQPPFDAGPMT